MSILVSLVRRAKNAIPRASILGAILLTGYLGGATATHVRIGDPFFFPIGFGVLIWGALFLPDNRLRMSPAAIEDLTTLTEPGCPTR